MMSLEDLLAEVQADIAKERGAPVEQLSAVALFWLGLVPEWSIELAEAAHFPTGGRKLGDWVSEAVRLGVCRRSTAQPHDVDHSDRFWMTRSSRASVLALAIDELGRTTDPLQQLASSIEKATESAAPHWASPLHPWVVLARLRPADAGERLLREVRLAVTAGDLRTTQQWITAAERLEVVMGSALGSALRRSRRYLALHHRRRYDESVLVEYIDRPDLIEPFNALLASESIWALHYLGDGGVGKTSLLRTLTAQRSRPSSEPLLFARVDFDHVSPEYPWRRPAQLLSLLADELEIAALTAAQERSLAEFRRSERRSGEVSSVSDVTTTLDSAEFDRSMRDFAELLERLPGRAVLMLDTCEELAKYHTPGEPAAAVEFTFEILERLHELVPTVRVVFAGRRLLAQSGADTAGWADVVGDRGRAPSQGRRYLDLCRVRGFTLAEASEFLEERVTDPSLRRAVLTATLEPTDDGIDHYNPFDVALYASWLRDEPDLSVDEIRSEDGVRYVEQRIVGRLEPELRDAIPVLVALDGRSTRELLAIALGSDARADTMHDRLRLQEWIDPTATSDGEVLVVQPRLLTRLRRYLESAPTAPPPSVRRGIDDRLRGGLDHSLRQRPSQLPLATAAIGFRLLSSADAHDRWRSLVLTAHEHGEWNELKKVADRLAADPDDGGLPESAGELRSMVLDDRALAVANTGGGRRALLERLATRSSQEPVAPGVSGGAAEFYGLVTRAIEGFVRCYSSLPNDEIDQGRFATDLETVLDTAVAAEIEIGVLRPVVDLAETVVERSSPQVPAEASRQESVSYLAALAARGRAICGDVDRAMLGFAGAEASIRSLSSAPATSPGWIRPSHPIDRVRLMWVEAMHALDPRPHPDQQHQGWLREANERADTIDGNRLASRILVWATEMGSPADFAATTAASDPLGPIDWDLELHDRVPPLLGALAIADCAAGREQLGLDRIATARATAPNERITKALDLVDLRLAASQDVDLGRVLERHVALGDERASRAASLLSVRRPEWSPPAGVSLSSHDLWRIGVAPDDQLVRRLELDAREAVGLSRAELALDLYEARWAGFDVEHGIEPSLLQPMEHPTFDAVSWERRLRLDLRAAALLPRPMPDPTPRARELAAEEGLLLRRRLPAMADQLLEFAGPRAAHASHVGVLTDGDGRARRRSRSRAPGARSFLVRIGPVLATVSAFLALGWFAGEAEAEPSGPAETMTWLAFLVFILMFGWMLYRRRLYRGPAGLLYLPRRWPYWMSWRVHAGGSGEVRLARAARHAGVGSPLARWVLLYPQAYTIVFELIKIGLLKRRFAPWKFDAATHAELPPPSVGAEHDFAPRPQLAPHPSQVWWKAAETSKSPICVEFVVDYTDEHRQIERDFADRFGRPVDGRPFVGLRHTGRNERHVIHPTRRAARRACVEVIAEPSVSSRLEDAWAGAGMRRAAGHDVGHHLTVKRATVLHVVGTPYETSRGWEIGRRFDERRSAPSKIAPVAFTPDSLSGGPARLIVLQPDPALEVIGIGNAREVVGCRHVASSLRASGHPIVIVLPMVSTELGVGLVERLADQVRDRQLDRLQIIDVSRDIRTFLGHLLRDEADELMARDIIADFTIYTNR